jgi:DNA-binding transcriptional MerR regulator
VPERAYLSIGEVLSLLRPEFPDLTISKIRFLESQGLLDPERTPSGYRKFYDQDIQRLRWILRQQREQYLPLKVIKGRLGADAEDDDRKGAGEALEEERPPDPANEAEEHPEPRGTDVTTSAVSAGQPNPLHVGVSSVSLTLDELAAAAGVTGDDIADLCRFGLVAAKSVGETTYFDEEALVVANLAGAFMRFGVEARHLRMYKTAAEREAGFFEQLVLPMLKQRNPQARRQALDSLVELTKLGQSMRAAMLRQALKTYVTT